METELFFCGDTMLGQRILEGSPFSQVESLIRGADISFCNLEAALAEGEALPKRHVIDTPAENLKYLAAAGFDIVNVGNNHVLDRGHASCLRLIEALECSGARVLGLQEAGRAKPVMLERKGVKWGFLGYADYGFSRTLMPLRERIALADVADLARHVDCVVVSLHWGYEYVEMPSPQQQHFARQLIDAGAHLVMGHHPHVAQGIEEYGGGIIAYSLGNFQFRIPLGDEFLGAGTGIVLRLWRALGGTFRYEAVPIQCGPSGRVELAGERSKATALTLSRVAELSVVVNGRRVGQLRWMRAASQLWFPSQLESWLYRVNRFGATHCLRMLAWLLRPINLCYFLLYFFSPRHASHSALFHSHRS